MLSTTIVIFREALEIAMIVGIVLAATRGLAGRMKWIVGGFALGALGAGVVAMFTEAISNAAEGMGQEFFNAMILFSAALVIGWTAVWMRKHAREMTAQLRNVGKDVTEGSIPLYSLSIIIGLAILREGAEIVLFTYGMLASGQAVGSIILGSTIGVILGTAAGVALYFGLIKLSAKYMLRVTSWLLVLLVAGLASQGTGYLISAGYFADWSATVWDSSWLLSNSSVMGSALHGLIGYNATPSQVEVFTYVATLLFLVAIMNFTGKVPSLKTPKQTAGATA